MTDKNDSEFQSRFQELVRGGALISEAVAQARLEYPVAISEYGTLEALADIGQGNVHQIAKQAGCDESTAYRHLVRLLAAGEVKRFKPDHRLPAVWWVNVPPKP